MSTRCLSKTNHTACVRRASDDVLYVELRVNVACTKGMTVATVYRDLQDQSLSWTIFHSVCQCTNALRDEKVEAIGFLHLKRTNARVSVKKCMLNTCIHVMPILSVKETRSLSRAFTYRVEACDGLTRQDSRLDGLEID